MKRHETEKFLYFEESYQQSEETEYMMGENMLISDSINKYKTKTNYPHHKASNEKNELMNE